MVSCSLLVSAIAGRNERRSTRGAPLRAALAAHARSGSQARCLLHECGSAQSAGEHLQRDVGHCGAGGGGGGNFFARRSDERTGGGIGAVAGRKPGVGHRTLARRHDRICHQPGTRSGTAASFTRCCPFQARADRTGAMRRFRSLAILPAGRSRDLLLHFAHL